MESIIGAAIILFALFAISAWTRDPDTEESPPLWKDLLLVIALVYLLRYLRQYQE